MNALVLPGREGGEEAVWFLFSVQARGLVFHVSFSIHHDGWRFCHLERRLTRCDFKKVYKWLCSHIHYPHLII